MANDLKSYVEKYLLNPAASFNVDDDGNQETKAQVVDSLVDEEHADVSQQSVSKLRARSAALQAERDPRYKGKKVLRKDLNKEEQVEYDPELSKYFAVEDDEADEDDDDDEEEEEHEGSEEEEDSMDIDKETDKVKHSLKQKKKNAERDNDSSDDDDGDDSENDEFMQKYHQQLLNEQSGTFIDDEDFSKFADDFDEEEKEEDSDEEDSEEENDDVEDTQDDSLKKFSSEDLSEEVRKGQAVKNQLALYDSLFEGRIGLQKVVQGTNQLPQHDTFKLFLKEKDIHFYKNLTTATSAARNVLHTLLQLQELLLKQNPETNHIITGKKPKPVGTESDEEITSSEDEEDQSKEESDMIVGGTKRKLKMDEYEGVLSKRHAAMLPFRDQTFNKWYEKTKLLSSHRSRDKFSGFEVSALQQLNNILANKHQLIRRTQLTGATRGTTYHVLGKSNDAGAEPESEVYDPEIFDDTDFYTRALEEVLKAKVALSDNMTDVSRKWIEIQNLRRKAKRKVDKKASKGRKLRYEVMSKMQQYLAPCLPANMDDAAINTLFASLFGKAVRKVSDITVQ